MAGNTFTWIGGSGSATLATNWSPTGTPSSGDTVIATSGTIMLPNDPNFQNNVVELGGATLDFTGDLFTNVGTPTIDPGSLITTQVTGVSTAAASIINSAGVFINEGSLVAGGPAGSTLTLNITANGTIPGYYVSYGQIDVAAGNSMTINIGATSELFNVSAIFVNGGSLFINADTAALAGGYAPAAGVIAVQAGGTLETNVGYPANLGGNTPTYVFSDESAGNTLKIDNVGSFGGSILGFGVNDTIDVGQSLAVGQVVYSNKTGILNLENASGTILASLLMSGDFQSGTFALSGTAAGSFAVTTGTDGNTLVTTSAQNDLYNSQSGVWQTASAWSNGIPSATGVAFIGLGATSPFTLNTGASPVQLGELNLASDNATLQITSDTTSTPFNSTVFAGELEVTKGQTLTTGGFRLYNGAIQVDSGATVNLLGRVVSGVSAENGVLTVTNGNTSAARIFGGTFLVNGGTVDAGTGQSGGNGGNILIGYDGGGVPATMTVQGNGPDAAVVTDTYAIVASDATSSGVLVLDGFKGSTSWTDQIDPHDTLTTRGYMIVGYNSQDGNTGTVAPPTFGGTATLTVENGATLTDQSRAYVGFTPNSTGSVTVTNGAVWNVGLATGGFLDVGLAGTADVTVSQNAVVHAGTVGPFFNNGTSSSAGGIGVGISVGSNGTLAIQSSSTLVSDDGMAIGRAGRGTLTVNAGTVQVSGNGIGVGLSANSNGSVDIAGNSQFTLTATTAGIGVGEAGNGILEINSGGTLIENVSGHGLGIGQTLGASGTVLVEGGGALLSLGSLTTGIAVAQSGTGLLDIESGGTVSIAAGGGGIGVGTTVGSNGSLIVEGPGALLVQSGTGALTVGAGGAGSMLVQNNGSVTDAGMGIGGTGAGSLLVGAAGIVSIGTQGLGLANSSAAVNGTLTVDGGNALVTSMGGVGAGRDGHALINVQNNGKLDIVNGGTNLANLNLGGFSSNATGGSASVTVASGGQITINNNLVIWQGSNATVVDAGSGIDIGTGGTFVSGAINVEAGHALYGDGVVDASVQNGGLLEATNNGSFSASTGGTLEIAGILSGAGSASMAPGATLQLDATPTGGQAINFSAGTVQTLILEQPGSGLSNAVSDVAVGDRIEFGSGMQISGVSMLNGNTAQVALVGGGTYDLTNVGFFTGASQFGVGHDNITGNDFIVGAAPCFAAGTRIGTDRGDVLVEALSVGDQARTIVGGRSASIVWIGQRSIDCRRHPEPRQVWPIRIAAGAFGRGKPGRDLFVSPDHALYLQGVLIPAKYMVNGDSIAQVPVDAVTYYHIELARHDVVLANGLAAESYLADAHRGAFVRTADWVALHPDLSTRVWEAEGCAPLVVAGPALEAARRQARQRRRVRAA